MQSLSLLLRVACRATLLCTLVACAGETAGRGGVNVDDAPELTLVEELRIGHADDPEIGFTQPGGIAVDASGNTYIVENRDRQIRVYDPQGTLIRRIGRRGSGPGEFNGNLSIGVQGDTLWAIDRQSRRLALFDLSGTVLATGVLQPVPIRLPPPEDAFGLLMPVRLRLDGTFESGDLTSFTSSRDAPPSDLAEGDTVRIPRVRFAATGAVIDTIGWDVRPPPSYGRTDMLSIGDSRYYVPVPRRPPDASYAVAGGRVHITIPDATGSTGQFYITRVSFDGDTLHHGVFRYGAVEYSDEHLDSLAWASARVPGGMVRLVGGRPVIPPMPADSADAFSGIRAAMSFPRHQPPIQGVRIAEDGALWIVRESSPDGSQRLLVFDAEDRVRGVITLPPRQFIAWTKGDVVWLYERDEMGIPWAVRMRIAG